jgi:5-methylcytosine-specific restriction endonuclease McrA
MRNCGKCNQKREDYLFLNKKGLQTKICDICRSKRREHSKKPEVMERHRLESKLYYYENRDRILENNAIYHLSIADNRKSYMLRWARENKHKIKEYHHKRRKLLDAGDLTSEQIKELFTRHPYCEYCGSESNLSLEHIIPLSRGGQNTLTNVTVSCKSCNSSKGTKLVEEWLNG